MTKQLDLCEALGVKEEKETEKDSAAKDSAAAKKKPVEEKIKAPATVCYAEHKVVIHEDLTLEQIRQQLEKTWPELTKKRTEMTYDKKKNIIVPIPRASKGGCPFA